MRVALIHRNRPRGKQNRMVGWWAYDVPDFEVTHFPIAKQETVELNKFRDYDVVFWEDYSCYPTFKGNGPPIVYQVGDSVISERHLKNRQKCAEQADLILVKRDDLNKFRHIGPTRRCADCVNDELFYDRGFERTIDVSWHCRGTTDRRYEVGRFLKEHCLNMGYNFVSGTVGGEKYATDFSRSKISVNQITHVRNQRFFDIMATGACQLTNPPKEVSGELHRPGRDYAQWTTLEELKAQVDSLLDTGDWQRIARHGYVYVMTEHTWQVRARECREILRQELGI